MEVQGRKAVAAICTIELKLQSWIYLLITVSDMTASKI